MLNGERWFYVVARLKRENTLKAGLLMMSLSANYVKNFAVGILRNHPNILKIYSALFQIEHGICSQCKLDCCKLVKHIKPLSNQKREAHIRSVAPNIACRKKLLAKLVEEPTRGNAWHADHIVPVYKGGGECTLENMRTLCVACHAEVTKDQQKERKEARKEERRKAEELLRNAVNQLKDDVSSSSGVQACEATEDDDSWLVTVPGSAYSANLDTAIQFQEVLRLNVDGSYIEGQNHAGCWGVVVRDNEGAVVAAKGGGRTDRVSSALHAELLAACGAVDLSLVWSALRSSVVSILCSIGEQMLQQQPLLSEHREEPLPAAFGVPGHTSTPVAFLMLSFSHTPTSL
ncbi:Zinc finger Ran-binding domain-containing protein 3 [Triticum urartu]|uniref:Zinc finger Ran-binding domain-containing protein 3 n=1 Tax=Triticum urartu TaxID=4572 RepID=M7Z2F9_TRIUA|nr:Zinc finger Ran-binding domain-containing protein 3 [Triticum urartu]